MRINCSIDSLRKLGGCEHQGSWAFVPKSSQVHVRGQEASLQWIPIHQTCQTNATISNLPTTIYLLHELHSWSGLASPLQRHMIRQALDVNVAYIKHYGWLTTNFQSADEITAMSMQQLKDSVLRRVDGGHSRYIAYLALNPTLEKPSIYSTPTPTYKLHNASRLRMIRIS